MNKVKELAAELMGVGTTRVWMNPDALSELGEAMTKDDIRQLIVQRAIKKRADAFQSRGRARLLHAKKKKGRKTGQGKRTGTKKARVNEKKRWMMNVRAQRKYLKSVRAASNIFFP